LCGKQLGVRVRRQHVVYPFICDFYVAAYRLVVEVDGGVHDSAEARVRDAWRDAELARVYGVRVLRIDAELVERDVYAAMAIVRAAL
jgi:very-short-patch-repair endonuclease